MWILLAKLALVLAPLPLAPLAQDGQYDEVRSQRRPGLGLPARGCSWVRPPIILQPPYRKFSIPQCSWGGSLPPSFGRGEGDFRTWRHERPDDRKWKCPPLWPSVLKRQSVPLRRCQRSPLPARAHSGCSPFLPVAATPPRRHSALQIMVRGKKIHWQSDAGWNCNGSGRGQGRGGAGQHGSDFRPG